MLFIYLIIFRILSYFHHICIRLGQYYVLLFTCRILGLKQEYGAYDVDRIALKLLEMKNKSYKESTREDPQTCAMARVGAEMTKGIKS